MEQMLWYILNVFFEFYYQNYIAVKNFKVVFFLLSPEW